MSGAASASRIAAITRLYNWFNRCFPSFCSTLWNTAMDAEPMAPKANISTTTVGTLYAMEYASASAEVPK